MNESELNRKEEGPAGDQSPVKYQRLQILPNELISQVLEDTWKRPSMHFFQVAVSIESPFPNRTSLQQATDASEMILGIASPDSDVDVALASPIPRGKISGRVGWYSHENESGYTRTSQLRSINSSCRRDIDVETSRREDGWVSIPMPAIGFHQLAFNSCTDVFAISGLRELEDEDLLERTTYLAIAFPEIFAQVKRLCFEAQPEARPRYRIPHMDENGGSLLNHCPHLEVVYLLCRKITLMEGKAVPRETVRFYGNGCTFVEVEHPDEAVEEQQIWNIPPEAHITFESQQMFQDQLDGLRRGQTARHEASAPRWSRPVGLMLGSLRPFRGTQPTRRSQPQFTFRVLARLEGYMD